ncbi:MAG: SRPBCC family protein [Thermoleophilia bacterium]
MSPLSRSIDIRRPAADVFAVLDDPTQQTRWQESLVSVEVTGGSPTRVGTEVCEVRRGPGGVTHTVRYRITHHEPGRRFAFEGGGGPVQVRATVRVDPLDDARCRVTAEFDFSASLKGRVLLPLVRREAARELPEDQARLRALLEGAA